MARWTVGEAVEALESRDKDAREDIGRTCPLFVTATYSELLKAIDMMTARQVEARLRQILDDEEVEGKEEPKKRKKKKVVEEPVKKPKKKEPEEDDEDDEDTEDEVEEEENDEPYLSEDEEDFLDDIFDDE